MDKFCLIGNPVNHSLSPKIFNFIFNRLNIKASYELCKVSKDNFKNFIINNKHSSEYNGINITTPYKEESCNTVDMVHSSCNDIKSINCIKIINNKLIGYNTDQYGLLMLIKKNKIFLNNKKIVVLGNGGVAKTVIKTLLDNYKEQIYIWGRNLHKVNSIITLFDKIPYQRRVQKFQTDPNEKYIVFNCISLNIDEFSINNILSYIPIRNIELMVDINYVKTKFNKKLIEKKCNVILGIDMLLYQALKSLDIWYGQNYSDTINFNELKKYIIHL